MTVVTGAGGCCWHCGGALATLDYGRGDVCRQCGRDTRVCKNCIHYDPAAHNECREPQAERVVEKERANFCDYFKPSDRRGGSVAGRETLKSAADALFRKP